MIRSGSLHALTVNAALTVLFSLPSPSVWGGDAPPISEIAAAILRSRRPVDSLSLTIERIDHDRDGRLSLKSTERYKFKGQMRYLDRALSRFSTTEIQTAVGQKVETRTTAEQWLTTHETFAFDGREMRGVVNDQIAEIHSLATRDVFPGSRFDSYYVRTIGWYISDPMAPLDFERHRQERCLPGALQANAFTASRDTLASGRALKVEGDFDVHAKGLDSLLGHETIWLSPSNGMTMVRREATDRRTGRQIKRVEAEEPIEIVKGCWIPRICRVYLPSESSASPTVSEMRVTAWSVNDQRDEDFVVAFPARAMVTDLVTTVEKDIPLRNPIVRYTDGNGRLLESPPTQVFARHRARYAPWIIGAMALFGALALWRHRRPSRRTMP